MSKHHRLNEGRQPLPSPGLPPPKPHPDPITVPPSPDPPRKPPGNLGEMPINFLLSVGDGMVGEFELARLQAVANLRKELHVILDKLIDEQSQAAVAAWFRHMDRNALKAAILNPPDPVERAKRQQRRKEGRPEVPEPMPSPSLFRPSLEPGAAHLAAAIRYQERNLAEGKCCECPQPLDPKSVRFCTTHLAIYRERADLKARAAGKPQRKPQRSKGTLAKVREAKVEQEKENANLALAERLRAAFPEAAAALAIQRKCRLCDEPAEPGQRLCADHFQDKRSAKTAGAFFESKPELTASEERERRINAGSRGQRQKNEALLKMMAGEENTGYSGE